METSFWLVTFDREKLLFQNYKHEKHVNSLSIDKDTIASGSKDKTCEVWSISKRQKLYSIQHEDYINHVRLLSDQKLGFDLITSGDDDMVKFWLQGRIVKSLEHSNTCYRFDLDKQNRLLAVATYTGVTVWRLDDYAKIGEEEIGDTQDVRFNASATKLIAALTSGAVHEISLE